MATKADKKEKVVKKKTDGPKKPLSPYMAFCKETRSKIVAENPAFTFGEVGKELGKRWKALTDEQKESFRSSA